MSANPGQGGNTSGNANSGSGGGSGGGGGGGGMDHVISSITPITLPSSSVGNFGPAMADAAATVSAAADPLSSPTPGMLTTHHLSSTGEWRAMSPKGAIATMRACF